MFFHYFIVLLTFIKFTKIHSPVKPPLLKGGGTRDTALVLWYCVRPRDGGIL